jgi:hypothetical protein
MSVFTPILILFAFVAIAAIVDDALSSTRPRRPGGGAL